MAAIKCPRHYAVGVKKTDTLTEYRTLPLTCKSWSCPSCAPKKSARYGKIFESIFTRKQLYFYTLTFHHRGDPRSVWARAAKSWNHLLTILHQTEGRFSYVRILESHTISCYPHYHIVVTKHFDAVKFGQALRRSGFGWQAVCKRVNAQGLNGYLRKYLAKPWTRTDAAQLRRLLRLRLVSVSRDLRLTPHNPTDWHLLKAVPTANATAADVILTFSYGAEDEKKENVKAFEIEVPFRLDPSARRAYIIGQRFFATSIAERITAQPI